MVVGLQSSSSCSPCQKVNTIDSNTSTWSMHACMYVLMYVGIFIKLQPQKEGGLKILCDLPPV